MRWWFFTFSFLCFKYWLLTTWPTLVIFDFFFNVSDTIFFRSVSLFSLLNVLLDPWKVIEKSSNMLRMLNVHSGRCAWLQLTICKHDRGFELGWSIEKQLQLSGTWTRDLKSGALTIRPYCFPWPPTLLGKKKTLNTQTLSRKVRIHTPKSCTPSIPFALYFLPSVSYILLITELSCTETIHTLHKETKQNRRSRKPERCFPLCMYFFKLWKASPLSSLADFC